MQSHENAATCNSLVSNSVHNHYVGYKSFEKQTHILGDGKSSYLISYPSSLQAYPSYFKWWNVVKLHYQHLVSPTISSTVIRESVLIKYQIKSFSMPEAYPV